MRIIVYREEDCDVMFEYTENMEPEHDGNPDKNGIIHGPFTIFYLSGYEEEDGVDHTECYYDDRYYAIVK